MAKKETKLTAESFHTRIQPRIFEGDKASLELDLEKFFREHDVDVVAMGYDFVNLGQGAVGRYNEHHKCLLLYRNK